MKLLETESNSAISADECATLVTDTVPLVMRTIRAEMRSHRTPDLSVPQFRALVFLHRNPRASLSNVADHIGLSLPSISKLIDRLVARGMVARSSAPADRRRLCLELTPLGESTLQTASSATQARLAEILAALSPGERVVIARAMHSLRTAFTPPSVGDDAGSSGR
jgi:DNA-binding MarR family transcriptional regulator